MKTDSLTRVKSFILILKIFFSQAEYSGINESVSTELLTTVNTLMNPELNLPTGHLPNIVVNVEPVSTRKKQI